MASSKCSPRGPASHPACSTIKKKRKAASKKTVMSMDDSDTAEGSAGQGGLETKEEEPEFQKEGSDSLNEEPNSLDPDSDND